MSTRTNIVFKEVKTLLIVKEYYTYISTNTENGLPSWFGMGLNTKIQLDVEDQVQETTTREDHEKKIACFELSKYMWSKAE